MRFNMALFGAAALLAAGAATGVIAQASDSRPKAPVPNDTKAAASAAPEHPDDTPRTAPHRRTASLNPRAKLRAKPYLKPMTAVRSGTTSTSATNAPHD